MPCVFFKLCTQLCTAFFIFHISIRIIRGFAVQPWRMLLSTRTLQSLWPLLPLSLCCAYVPNVFDVNLCSRIVSMLACGTAAGMSYRIGRYHVQVTWPLTVSHSARLGVEPLLGLMTWFPRLFRHSAWRGVVCLTSFPSRSWAERTRCV
jgi:hypothetical protein